MISDSVYSTDLLMFLIKQLFSLARVWLTCSSGRVVLLTHYVDMNGKVYDSL